MDNIKIEFTLGEAKENFEKDYKFHLSFALNEYNRDKALTIKAKEQFHEESLTKWNEALLYEPDYKYHKYHDYELAETNYNSLLNGKIPIEYFEWHFREQIEGYCNEFPNQVNYSIDIEKRCSLDRKFFYCEIVDVMLGNGFNVRKIGKINELMDDCIAIAMVLIIKAEMNNNTTSSNSTEITKVKFKGSVSEFGYMIYQFTENGFIQKPSNSYLKDAEYYLSIYEISTTTATLAKELNINTNSLIPKNKVGIDKKIALGK